MFRFRRFAGGAMLHLMPEKASAGAFSNQIHHKSAQLHIIYSRKRHEYKERAVRQ